MIWACLYILGGIIYAILTTIYVYKSQYRFTLADLILVLLSSIVWIAILLVLLVIISDNIIIYRRKEK